MLDKNPKNGLLGRWYRAKLNKLMWQEKEAVLYRKLLFRYEVDRINSKENDTHEN